MVRSHWAVILLIAAFGIVALLVLPGRRFFATWNDCVPTPDVRLTAKPGPSPVMNGVTPIPYAEVIDLASQMPERDKAQVIVFRCEGTFALYWVPGDFDLTKLELGRGDTIFTVFSPSSLVGQQIHVTAPTVEIILTATPELVTPLPTETPRSYPPTTPEPTQTPVPYDS